MERVKRIKRAIRGKESYQSFTEHTLMKEYSISYNQLMEFPYEKYLEFSKILALEAKEEKKEKEKQKKQMDKKANV